MGTISTPLRNDAIARQIVAAIASTHSFHLTPKIESILDNHYRSRRARAASRDGRGAARTGDKATAVEAANLVHVTNQQRIILRTLTKLDTAVSATIISIHAGLKLGSASTRMAALVANELVREVGYVVEEGRKKTTYCITNAGRQWLSTMHAS